MAAAATARMDLQPLRIRLRYGSLVQPDRTTDAEQIARFVRAHVAVDGISIGCDELEGRQKCLPTSNTQYHHK